MIEESDKAIKHFIAEVLADVLDDCTRDRIFAAFNEYQQCILTMLEENRKFQKQNSESISSRLDILLVKLSNFKPSRV